MAKITDPEFDTGLQLRTFFQTYTRKGWNPFKDGEYGVWAVPNGRWNEALPCVPSGIDGKYVPLVARVDYHGNLEDLTLWFSRTIGQGYTPLFELKGWNPVYS